MNFNADLLAGWSEVDENILDAVDGRFFFLTDQGTEGTVFDDSGPESGD